MNRKLNNSSLKQASGGAGFSNLKKRLSFTKDDVMPKAMTESIDRNYLTSHKHNIMHDKFMKANIDAGGFSPRREKQMSPEVLAILSDR